MKLTPKNFPNRNSFFSFDVALSDLRKCASVAKSDNPKTQKEIIKLREQLSKISTNY